jgi:rhamnosyltransferase
MIASIVIRTYNEEKHLNDLLESIRSQNIGGVDKEVVVVDSGSTDGTLRIADLNQCKIIHIPKDQFTFGKSLNTGCDASRGDYLIFVSGHCVPVDDNWLQNILRPVVQGTAVFAYGRQIGNGQSRFSECQLFKKYYPETSRIQDGDIFCNNANAAMLRSVWHQFKFNESLTGLEDMDMGRKIINAGMKIAYVADAPVYHVHDESWLQVRNRYEREAMALQKIMPQVHISLLDFVRYVSSAVLLDLGAALLERNLIKTAPEIVLFRLMQFWGSYRGNHEHRKLSNKMKERYFYPR